MKSLKQLLSMSIADIRSYALRQGHEIHSETLFNRDEWAAQIYRLDNEKQVNPMKRKYETTI